MEPRCCTGPRAAKEISKTADFLKIISEENRLKILCLLQAGEKCVCEIWQLLDIPQNLASHHLKVLKDSKLLTARKEGLNIYYSIDRKVLGDHSESLNKLLSAKSKKS